MTSLLTSIGHMFNGLSGNTLLGKIAIAAGAVLASYFVPISGLLLTCFLCSAVDMIYGIKVAIKQNKKITSNKSWKGTLAKIRDEFLLILLTHLVEHVVFGPTTVLLSSGITVIISLTEMWSILENLNTLDPEGPWRSLGKFLKKKGEDYMGFDINLEQSKHDKETNDAAE